MHSSPDYDPKKLEQFDTRPTQVHDFAEFIATHIPDNVTHLIDIGCGDGRIGTAVKALLADTHPLLVLVGVEIDPRRSSDIDWAVAGDALTVAAEDLGHPPPATTAIIGNFPFSKIVGIFRAWAGRACWSASLEPPRSSPRQADMIPAKGWLEVRRKDVGRVRFDDYVKGGPFTKGNISFVARSHPGVYPVTAKGASASILPHFLVQRTSSANAVGQVKVGAIVAEKWEKAVRDRSGLTQANYFFRVAFGSFDGHTQRFRESLPSLRTWYSSSRSNMSLTHLFEGYHGLATPNPPSL